MIEYKIIPVGTVHSKLKYRYETPRQGILADNLISSIELSPSKNYEQALIGLDGIERLWIIYWFHKSKDSKLMVTPPRNNEQKIGVFATRAPHRPNQIGLSCVKLLKIEGRTLYITESDILDGTPVLDIKPYLPYADSFPEAATGWIRSNIKERYEITIEPGAVLQGEEIKTSEGSNLLNYAKVQLQFNPGDISRKRITKVKDNNFILKFRKWNICYSINENEMLVRIMGITL